LALSPELDPVTRCGTCTEARTCGSRRRRSTPCALRARSATRVWRSQPHTLDHKPKL